MRAFYTEKGIDILKDAVSLPGVSLHYLLRGTIERGAELWTPCKEAYEMLKGAMVGGPSIVFNRFHEAGVTQIRPHRLKKNKEMPPHHWLRRQRAVLVNNAERHAGRERKSRALRGAGRA